jgi:hypothetical protein
VARARGVFTATSSFFRILPTLFSLVGPSEEAVLFTTLTFLLFLPVVFAAYWLLPRQRCAQRRPVGGELLLLRLVGRALCRLMAVASLVDFVVALVLGADAVAGAEEAVPDRLGQLPAGPLSYFKYAGFFMENAQALAGALGLHSRRSRRRWCCRVGISSTPSRRSAT